MDELQRIFEEQRANRWRIARTSANERIAKLNKLKEAILSRQADFRLAGYEDLHKNPTEVDLLEIFPVISEINHAVKHLRSWMKPVSVSTPIFLLGSKSLIKYEARGQVLLLSPWNYPLNLAVLPLIAAIAAGNCVILKPSVKAPKTSELVKKVVAEVYDEDHVAVVNGDDDVGNKLLDLPFDHIFFTGSTSVGKLIMKKAAEHYTSTTLELGGKSPVIVDHTANIKEAVDRILWGKLVNSGQTCMAPDYLLIDERVFPQFVDLAKQFIYKRFGKEPADRKSSTNFCRIINSQHTERLKKLVDDAVADGAKVEIGGESDLAMRYISPTILSNVPLNSRIMEEEIFGPILPIITFRNIDEAITIINGRPNPLAIYLFSGNKLQLKKISNITSSGQLVLNYTFLQVANPWLPFGGVRQSGAGRYHGKHGFIELSNTRSIMLAGKIDPNKMAYPPYTKFSDFIVNFIRKYFA